MRKLMWFVVGFSLVTILGIFLWMPEFLLVGIAASGLLVAGSFVVVKRFSKWKIVTIVLLGCLFAFSWLFAFDRLYLSAARAADGVSGEYVVYFTDDAQESQYGYSAEGFVVLQGKPYRVFAYLPEGVNVNAGDSVSCYCWFSCTLPGSNGDSNINRSHGYFLRVKVLADPIISVPEKLPWFAYPALTRTYLTDMIHAVFPEDVSGFVRALLLGDTDGLDYATDTAFKVSGIRHIVAVSGLHVSILFSLIFILTGKRNWMSSLLGIPILFVFAAITGFTPSITRACIMHSLMALAFVFRKEYDPPTALSFAVLVMLVRNPWTVCHVGFQLSVGCIIGILLFADRIYGWLMEEKRLGRGTGRLKKISSWFATSVSVSVGASLVVTPLCAYYFGLVSLVGVLTNLLTLWMVTVSFYCIVFTCLVGLLSASVAAMFGWLAAWPLRYVLCVSKMLAALPFAAVYTESIYIVFWLALSYLMLAIYLIAKKKHPVLYACCSCVFLCVALLVSWVEPLTDECRVTVLDVGQGQCILLQSDGKSYLVDCGGDSDTAAADEAAGLLLSQGISRLDGLILTHYDADHAAGAMHLLSRVPTDCLYLPASLDKEGLSAALLEYQEGAVQMVTGDVSIRYGDSVIHLVPSEFAASDNESGLCILFQTESCDILITGDRGFSGEMELMRNVQLPQLELLIVGHHGSKYSTCEELLAATMPEYAIISVSADNIYGHPTQEVLNRLAECGCCVYRTDRDGTIIFRR